jgi:hypothetical protein
MMTLEVPSKPFPTSIPFRLSADRTKANPNNVSSTDRDDGFSNNGLQSRQPGGLFALSNNHEPPGESSHIHALEDGLRDALNLKAATASPASSASSYQSAETPSSQSQIRPTTVLSALRSPLVESFHEDRRNRASSPVMVHAPAGLLPFEMRDFESLPKNSIPISPFEVDKDISARIPLPLPRPPYAPPPDLQRNREQSSTSVRPSDKISTKKRPPSS